MEDQAQKENAQSIDYTKSASEVAKAKQAAHDADQKRLAKEHEQAS